MAIDRSRKLLTYDDYAKLPDDGKLYELLDGELVVSPAPTILHQRLLTELLFEPAAFLRSNPLGEVLTGPRRKALPVAAGRCRQPSLMFSRGMAEDSG